MAFRRARDLGCFGGQFCWVIGGCFAEQWVRESSSAQACNLLFSLGFSPLFPIFLAVSLLLWSENGDRNYEKAGPAVPILF